MDTNLLKVGKYNNSFNSVLGINPNETRIDSIELIKRYKDNILIGIKLDKSSNYLYISTMYDIQESKIQRRLHSGRLKNSILTKQHFNSILWKKREYVNNKHDYFEVGNGSRRTHLMST